MGQSQLEALDTIASWVHDDSRIITPVLVANELLLPISDVHV